MLSTVSQDQSSFLSKIMQTSSSKILGKGIKNTTVRRNIWLQFCCHHSLKPPDGLQNHGSNLRKAGCPFTF